MKLKYLFMLLLLGATGNLSAQNKFAYTNVDYILSLMPDTKVANQELKEYENTLTSQIKAKTQFLQRSFADYQEKAAGMTPEQRASTEQELQKLQNELQQFQGQAESLMVQKQQQVLQPLYDKIQDAINTVAAEQSYTYIFRSESLLFAPEGDEISELVLKKLGVELKKSE